jgi:hypothetical protein
MIVAAPCVASAQDTLSLPASGAPPERAAGRCPRLGVAVGTPGYANLTASCSVPHVSLRASGGRGSGGRTGVQGDAVWNIVQEANLSVGVALVAGSFTTHDGPGGPDGAPVEQRQPYVGVAIDAFLAGFHLQAGLAHGFHDYPRDPQLLVQFGYDLRLR